MSKNIKVDRSPRETEENEFNEREFEMSDDMSWLEKGSLYFDPSLPKRFAPGMEWGWVVSKIRHEPQDTSFSNAKRKGWVPIPAGKYACLNYLLPHSVNQQLQQNGVENSTIIEIGGQILCERPLTMRKREDEYYARKAKDADISIDEVVQGKGLTFAETQSKTKANYGPIDFAK